MIKKDTIVLLISTAVGIGIITILSFFIVWIGFPVEDPKDSFKDSLEFSSSIFGGLTTFGAAIIAAHLFNDWKVQHNKTVIAIDAKNAFKLIHNERNYLHDIEFYLNRISEKLMDYRFAYNDQNILSNFNNLIKIHNNNRFNLAEFVFLIEDSALHTKITLYRNEIGSLNSKVNSWIESRDEYVKNYDEFIDLIKKSKKLNGEILGELKYYMLYKQALT